MARGEIGRRSSIEIALSVLGIGAVSFPVVLTTSITFVPIIAWRCAAIGRAESATDRRDSGVALSRGKSKALASVSQRRIGCRLAIVGSGVDFGCAGANGVEMSRGAGFPSSNTVKAQLFKFCRGSKVFAKLHNRTRVIVFPNTAQILQIVAQFLRCVKMFW